MSKNYTLNKKLRLSDWSFKKQAIYSLPEIHLKYMWTKRD